MAASTATATTTATVPATAAPSPSRSAADSLDSAIAISLHLWPALSTAVANQWGGASSAEKRDWFAGAVSGLMASTPAPDMDAAYLEEFLLNVMNDEFDVNVEDGSAADVAQAVLAIAVQLARGDWSGVDALEERWRERAQRPEAPGSGKVVVREEVEEGSSGESVDDESGEDEDDDRDAMEVDAAQQRPRRERPPPEVDDEGFTTVRRRK